MAGTKTGNTLLRDPSFGRLKHLATRWIGLAYWQGKDRELAEALATVVRSMGLTPSELADRLVAEGGAGPVSDAVVDAVTVGETFFFRYREQFAALDNVILPERLAHHPAGRTLSVWSAGCSIGAEPYSIAMAVARAGLPPGWNLTILGTDISRPALAQAVAGIYGAWALRGLSEEERESFFTHDGNNWRVRDVYRTGVEFRRHNLVSDPPPVGPGSQGRFDVIFCRNVLMYFDGSTREQVLNRLAQGLVEGGWLLVGHAEVGAEVAGLFQPVTLPGCTLYRRRKPNLQRAEPPPRPARPPCPAVVRPPVPVPPASPKPVPEMEIQQLLDAGAFEPAIARAATWAERSPLNPVAHFLLALALEAVDSAKAIEEMRRAVYLDPRMALAHFHLMRLSGGAEAERHRRALLQAIAGLPEDAPLPHGHGLTVRDISAVTRHLASGAER